MINFCIATPFEKSFLLGLSRLNSACRDRGRAVREVFGSLPVSVGGSARPPDSVPDINFDQLKEHVCSAHEHEIEFNYLFNAPCLGNLEYTKQGRKKLFQFLDGLVATGIDRITLTIPYLVDIIRKRYPHLPVTISVISYVDTPLKAVFYEKMGVDRIILDIDVNRNFQMLREIRKKVSLDLELLMNSTCLLQCPMKHYHYSVEGHFSQEQNHNGNGNGDEPCVDELNPCKQKCMMMLMDDPRFFISSPWIRPEDVETYADMGYKHFKIAGREFSGKVLLAKAEKYLAGRFDGNLVSLLGAYQEPTSYRFPLELYIDNRQLEGFLEPFLESRFPCQEACDGPCYCDSMAKRAVRIGGDARSEWSKLYGACLARGIPENGTDPLFEKNGRRFVKRILSFYWKVRRYYAYRRSGQIEESNIV